MTINGDTFLDYLKKIHAKFPMCYLFMDKASSPLYKSKKVLKYFEDNKNTLIPVYLPTASPEFMVMEEVWNMAKRDLFVLKYYQSFADLKNKISKYFRTKRFNLNMKNYFKRCFITYANWYSIRISNENPIIRSTVLSIRKSRFSNMY